ncbi:hypothetical protein LCGC14_0416780 [marine sediment metagenome]|uniref:Uncharacterized protein n=1 Tax=marine sediment metagenome TaxID=412755 RepID=A0A0F9SY37_9ZZZZ
MAITTDTVLADTVPTVLEKARFTQRFKAVMASLCWNIRKELHDGKNVNVPYFGTVVASSLTEGVDMADSEDMEDTLVTITPAEVGCKIILTDKLVRDNNEDIKGAAGRILGEAMEYKRDVDLLGQLDDATTSLGSTSTTGTMGAIAAARALLSGNAVSAGGPAPMPYAFVHHPFALLDLVDVLTPVQTLSWYPQATQVPSLADEVLRNYTMGKLFGMPVIEDGNLDISTSSSGKGGVFATGEGGALILATADEWSIEPERDASLRATELNVVGEYGVGEYLAGWMVEILWDATTPA